MQPLAFAENGVCKRKKKSTAGAGAHQANRASGDRLFFMKCAEGLAPKQAQGMEAEWPRP
ncbi:hypothetical protein TALK_15430 [Thalassospira alkalitolerans]|uniref:Uncharacterized protein n=1 Tax=Thalassospira alkalitolerans TaxID=1293890 RepID=A0A1Y2LC23_9PROT|nr:hypothetical protein TALK_15430 [Thalassospira alkalitolerans]